MNTKEMAMEYRITSWAQALQERIAGKENIKEFCARKGVSRNTYFYWQRKIRKSVVEQIMPGKTATKPVPAGWREVETNEAPGSGSSTVTIEIGTMRIQANEQTNTVLLSKVCKVLVELC